MAVPPLSSAPASPEDKSALRARMRRVRAAFVDGGRPPLVAPPPFIELLRPGMTVAGYVAIGGEADPLPLLEAATARGCRTALPHVTTMDAPMRFLAWRPGDPLERGPFALLQPRADAIELAPDIVLTPLVAFDGALNRLGQGAGFYDRAFAKLADALRIGVAWSIQQIDHVPTDPWDAPLDAIITERSWITR